MKIKQNIKNGVLGMAAILTLTSSIAATSTLDVTVTGSVVGGCIFNQTSYMQNWGEVMGLTTAKAVGDLEYFCSEGVSFEIKPNIDAITGNGFQIKFFKNSDYSEANRLTTSGQGIVGVGTGHLSTSSVFYRLEADDDTIDEGDGNLLFQPGTIDHSVTYTITF